MSRGTSLGSHPLLLREGSPFHPCCLIYCLLLSSPTHAKRKLNFPSFKPSRRDVSHTNLSLSLCKRNRPFWVCNHNCRRRPQIPCAKAGLIHNLTFSGNYYRFCILTPLVECPEPTNISAPNGLCFTEEQIE